MPAVRDSDLHVHPQPPDGAGPPRGQATVLGRPGDSGSAVLLDHLQPALLEGALAALASAVALAWRSRTDVGSAPAALNAPSHWLFGDRALRRNRASLRYTGVGSVVHTGSAFFWALLYRALRLRHRRPDAWNAATDAATVTAIAAVVDLQLVPERLRPGFERRLRGRSLALVYLSFGLGLLAGGLMAQWRRRP
jgi:hypothetical protein